MNRFLNWIKDNFFAPHGEITDQQLAEEWLRQAERRRAEIKARQKLGEHNGYKHLKDQTTDALRAFNASRGIL